MRTWLTALLVLATLTGCSDDDSSSGRPPSYSALPTTEGAGPVSVVPGPYGGEYVGLGSVTVVVPTGVRHEMRPCSRTLRPCIALVKRDRKHGSELLVELLTLDQAHLDELDLEPIETVSGVEAVAGDLCPPTADCTLPAAQAVAVPSQGFAALVRGSGRWAERVHDIVSSVALLRKGTTAVPPIPYGISVEEAERLLTDAGLDADVEEMAGPHYVTGTVPPAGSVVFLDSAPIKVLVGDG